MTLMETETKFVLHIINSNTSRTGGRTWGRSGGHFRESEVYCSCGWSERENGQTYAESLQYAKDHLRHVGQWFTQAERDVYYAAVGRFTDPTRTVRRIITEESIMEETGRSLGIVRRSLRRLLDEGYVEQGEFGYDHTDKTFNWFDGKRF